VGNLQRGLYDEGRHYDLLMPGPNDLPFYRRQVELYGQPVLELACGTGRLTVPLGQAGFDITGLDVSPAMLAVARAKAERCGATIILSEGNCIDFSLNRKFHLIFIAENSLSHLLERKDVEACFRCVRQHLAPGGRFVVDVFTPSARILARDGAQPYPIGEYEDPDGGGRIRATETSEYDAATQVKHIVWHHERIGKAEHWDVPLKLRMFYPQEIDALLAYNGFVIEHKYGDFNGSPFGAASAKQLIVCSDPSGWPLTTPPDGR
jgi:SAM-dependent methyltransferase